MILIALGSNASGPWGSPRETLERALGECERRGVRVVARSRWYRSAPYGYVHQPAFVNGVVMVETDRAPLALLDLCHAIERDAGRRRGVRWGPRCLDMDLIAYDRVCIASRAGAGERRSRGATPLSLPHPGMPLRPFVLVPLRDIAPRWRHPLTGKTANEMLRKLGPRAQGAVTGLADRRGRSAR